MALVKRTLSSILFYSINSGSRRVVRSSQFCLHLKRDFGVSRPLFNDELQPPEESKFLQLIKQDHFDEAKAGTYAPEKADKKVFVLQLRMQVRKLNWLKIF